MAPKKNQLARGTRGKGIVLPDWFLTRINRDALEYGVAELGRALAIAVDRQEGAWDHSTVSRFLRNENTTAEMAEAFAVLFDLPKVYYVPDSYEAAVELQRAAKRHETPGALSKEQARRLSALDQLRDTEVEASNDQTPRVGSSDEEGTGRRRGVGRTARRRSPTS